MKLKRLLALIGVIVLAAMYLSTVFFAVTDSPISGTFFKASIFCTVVIPVIIYGYGLIYRYVIRKDWPDQEDKNDHAKDA